MSEQINLFEMLYNPIKITKPIRLIECFAGYGSQPLAVISKDWENWFIKENNIQLCELYYEPYNFERTGCKGCPFALNLQKELDTLKKFFPAERKQCEYIWKPVYEEYRRLGYRLNKEEQLKLF